MRRREFITLVGGATASWPLAARAQQPAMPVVGFLSIRGPSDAPRLLDAFLKGLKEVGYITDLNVRMEYRWADRQSSRLPEMAAELVRRDVAVIAAAPTQAALAAKAATTTIPIVFEMGANPVKFGLVASLNRPGGNVTGVTQMNNELLPKRLELLHELLPTVTVMALLIDSSDSTTAEDITSTALSAAQDLKLKLHVLNASSESDIDAAFTNLIQLGAGGLVIGGGALFVTRQEQLAALAVHYKVPAVFEAREFVAAGGLASYGSSVSDSYRLAGVYVGRILKGDTPARLPVQQSTKFELIINLKTAKALGIKVPLPLLGRADEQIE